jgi:O-antigen/teichoic acid export membrane protein
MFGPEFPSAQPGLIILVLGQTINVVMGPVALLLVMTGHEREVAVATALSAALNIALNLVMIPAWGLMGTSLAVAISVSVWNILLAVRVRRRLGLHSTAAGIV